MTKNGKLVLQKRDGGFETHSWTISNWLTMSGVCYQSRAKMFCVQKDKGI